MSDEYISWKEIVIIAYWLLALGGIGSIIFILIDIIIKNGW